MNFIQTPIKTCIFWSCQLYQISPSKSAISYTILLSWLNAIDWQYIYSKLKCPKWNNSIPLSLSLSFHSFINFIFSNFYSIDYYYLQLFQRQLSVLKGGTSVRELSVYILQFPIIPLISSSITSFSSSSLLSRTFQTLSISTNRPHHSVFAERVIITDTHSHIHTMMDVRGQPNAIPLHLTGREIAKLDTNSLSLSLPFILLLPSVPNSTKFPLPLPNSSSPRPSYRPDHSTYYYFTTSLSLTHSLTHYTNIEMTNTFVSHCRIGICTSIASLTRVSLCVYQEWWNRMVTNREYSPREKQDPKAIVQ